MTAALPLLAALLGAPLDPPAPDHEIDRRVRELARQLSDKGTGSYLRQEATLELKKIGPRARAAVPALLRALHEPGRGWAAAEALQKVDPDNKEAVPALVRDLNSRDPDVRLNACAVLPDFGERARVAIPALVRALCDPDRWVRRVATTSLTDLDPAGPATAAALGALLLDREPDDLGLMYSLKPAARNLLATVLGGDLAAVGPAVQRYSEALWSKRDRVRERRLWAAAKLTELGLAAKPALPALRLAADDGDPQVCRAATEALKRVEGQGTRR